MCCFEYIDIFGEYLQRPKAYAIMSLGRNVESAHLARKDPSSGYYWGLLFRFGRVAYALG